MINSNRSAVYLMLLTHVPGFSFFFLFSFAFSFSFFFCHVLIIVMYSHACKNSIGIKVTQQEAENCLFWVFLGGWGLGRRNREE